MARGVNKVILVGRLGRDPEVRYTQDGQAIVNFSVATSIDWKDKSTGEKKEKTEWHRVVAFRKLGEICGEYLSKGKQVYIEGRLQTRSWEQDGTTRYMTEVVATDMQMLSPKGSGNNDYTGYDSGDPGYGSDIGGGGSQGPSDSIDDDIPF